MYIPTSVCMYVGNKSLYVYTHVCASSSPSLSDYNADSIIYSSGKDLLLEILQHGSVVAREMAFKLFKVCNLSIFSIVKPGLPGLCCNNIYYYADYCTE